MLIKFESGKYHNRLAKSEVSQFNVQGTESLAERLAENAWNIYASLHPTQLQLQAKKHFKK